jgi:long-chain-fatty-acid--CoA ligase ACSBG
MSIEVFKYFMSLDIIILELYGMSENTGPQTFNTLEERKLGTVGKTIDSCRTKIADADPATGEGEIAMWGRNCMMGYLSQEEKTKKEFDDDNYFRSGDVGVEDEDGFIKITGRIKELIITAGGENVAPSPIEDAIKAELPLISNVVLIGDKQKFLSCFLTLKVNIVEDEPTNELMQVAVEWCAEKGRRHRTVDDILNPPDPVIMKEIQNGIDRANKQAVSNACRVQRWTVLPGDLSIKGGELGPTLKLKRFAFMSKYTDTIDRIYC